MLKALLIANDKSGTSHKLHKPDLPGRWILDPAGVTADDVRSSDLIALFGGDGTIQMTMSQLLRQMPPSELPPVAVLPFGTTNMSAKCLNRNRSRRRAVASLDRAIRSGAFATTARSLVRVSQGDALEHGFFFGAGIIAEIIERWDEQHKPGVIGNRIQSLRALVSGLSRKNSKTRICIDGESRSVYGLLASTLDRLIFGTRPFWAAGQPGDLKLTWVDSDAPDLLRHAPALLRGKARMAGVPGYHSCTTEHMRLSFRGCYSLDGESFLSGGDSMTISRSDPVRWLSL